MNTCNFSSSYNTAYCITNNDYCNKKNKVTTYTTLNFYYYLAKENANAKNIAYFSTINNQYLPVANKPKIKDRSVKNFNYTNTDLSLAVAILNDSINPSPIKILAEQIKNQRASNATAQSFHSTLSTTKYNLVASLTVPITCTTLSITVSKFFLIPLFVLTIPSATAFIAKTCYDYILLYMFISKNMSLYFLENIFKNYTKPDHNINLAYENLLTNVSSELYSKKEIIDSQLNLFYLFYRYFKNNGFVEQPEQQTIIENYIKLQAIKFYEILFSNLEVSLQQANFDIDELRKAKNQYLDSLTIADILQIFYC